MSLKVIYSPTHKEHNPPLEIYDDVKEGYAEKPERIESIVASLQAQSCEVIAPEEFDNNVIEQLHHPAYIEFLKRRSEALQDKELLYPSYFITDTYIAITPGTFSAAKMSVNIALTGAKMLLSGEKLVYSLCRPPGHHAEERSMGGYCFFNNASISANELSKKGRVAILDVDFHHGNGTQSMFYDRNDVLYVSIHADPTVKYPYKSGFSNERGKGEGKGFNKNYPLPLGTGNEEYLPTLLNAIEDIHQFKPEFLVVSLGFDTYENDPIGGFMLTIPFYEKMGAEVKKINVPTLVIQEGGYHIEDLGKMALSFFKGFS